MRGEGLRFKEEGVRDILKDVFLPWFNAFRFLMQNIDRLRRVSDGMKKLYNYRELCPLTMVTHFSRRMVWS